MLLEAVRRVSEAQEGISIPQRRLLEVLVDADGDWVEISTLANWRRESTTSVGADLGVLARRGFAEKRDRKQTKYRATQAGGELLERIRSREEDMPLLRRICQLTDQRRLAAGTKVSVAQLNLQRRVLNALRTGPKTRAELRVNFATSDHQLRYTFEALRNQGKIEHLQQGLWGIREEVASAHVASATAG